MMSKKNLMIIIVSALCLISLAQAEEKGNKAEADYRIEVAVDTSIDGMLLIKPTEKEIKFISPSGKAVKTLPFDYEKDCMKIVVAPTLKYLINVEEIPAEMGRDSSGELIKVKGPRVRFSYINARGIKRWEKVMDVQEIFGLPGLREGETWMPYFFKISRDGGRIVFVRSYEGTHYDYRSDIIVFDTLGNKVASVDRTYGLEKSSDLQISSDGKIVGAEVWFPTENSKGWALKHLFFLHIETGRTKIVKAQGEKWDAGFGLSNITPLPPSEKVAVGVFLYDGPSPRSCSKPIKQVYKYLTFDEIPDDLLVLFLKRGEQ